MSRFQIQFVAGESLKIGEKEYCRIAGDFAETEGQLIAEVFCGQLIIPRDTVFAVVALADDFDCSGLDADVFVVN
jgi:hypothetical protein